MVVRFFRLVAAAAGRGLSCAVAVTVGLGTTNVTPVEAAHLNPTQTSVSSNWAGYVASGGDTLTVEPTTFSTVSARWIQPKADCRSTASASSAFWVGLGGDSNNSNALEQAGTEADCTSAGARYFAWYELVPAGSVRLGLKVTPGDELSVSVSVKGKQISILMRNLSHGTSFAKTLRMVSPDTSSAEWIAEAPSVCGSSAECGQQPLANFGTVRFSGATATSSGHAGSISDSSWTATPVKLQTGGSPGRFFVDGGFAPMHTIASALPTPLTRSGTTFSVNWHKPSPLRPSRGTGDGSPYSL